MSLEEIFAKIEARVHEPITEVHIVGGCHPDLPFSFYLEMLRGIKQLRPEVHLQAFTAVEVAHLADKAGLNVADTLLGPQGGGPGVAARGWRRSLQPPHPAASLPREALPGRLAGGGPNRP